jgi:hypothetical protein
VVGGRDADHLRAGLRVVVVADGRRLAGLEAEGLTPVVESVGAEVRDAVAAPEVAGAEARARDGRGGRREPERPGHEGEDDQEGGEESRTRWPGGAVS